MSFDLRIALLLFFFALVIALGCYSVWAGCKEGKFKKSVRETEAMYVMTTSRIKPQTLVRLYTINSNPVIPYTLTEEDLTTGKETLCGAYKDKEIAKQEFEKAIGIKWNWRE